MPRISKNSMPSQVRFNYILDWLENQEHITISEIAKKCRVSEITVRRDLDELERQGFLIRTHGGAIRNKPIENLFSFDNKMTRNVEKKNEICRYAARFIKDHDVIFIDCGTTVYHLVQYINHSLNIRVITNSLPVVSKLIQHSNIRVSLIGGELDHERKALYGGITESMFTRFRASKAFVGAGGISLAHGISSNDEKEAMITQRISESANEVILLCDSSKFEHVAFYTYAPITMPNLIITDNQLDPKILNQYKENNINILLAEP